MNLLHRWMCHSEHWKNQLRDEMVPWVLAGLDLGPDVLELGPGPGFTTDLLRQRCRHLTAIEIDANYAGPLQQRLQGANVTVVHADATATTILPNYAAVNVVIPKTLVVDATAAHPTVPMMVGTGTRLTALYPLDVAPPPPPASAKR